MLSRLARVLAAALLALAAVTTLPTPAHAWDNGVARTPPMGWNTWNAFKCGIDEQLIQQMADAMVTSGMRDAGYRYVVVDDCWMAQARDADGNLQADPAKFPHGMAALAAYVHARGLKFGIYESPGERTCQGYPGSAGHETQDATLFASWGVDYLKYDWCSTAGNAVDLFGRMHDALAATGRPILYSVNAGGASRNAPWSWGADQPWAQPVVNMWRTSNDIWASWDRDGNTAQNSVMTILDQQVGLERFAGPGHWNDPDMLEVGNPGLSDVESRAHLSLWALLAAPLIAGNDLRTMTPATRQILTNPELIAIDQDPLGRQASKIADDGDHEVWSRRLANGDIAVALLNRGRTTATVGTNALRLDLPVAAGYLLRDVWAHRSTVTASSIRAAVPAHGAVVYRVHPATPDAAPPAVSVHVDAPAYYLPGYAARVRVTVTNDGRLPAASVSLAWQAPSGWQAEPDRGEVPRLVPGASWTSSWKLTPPVGANPGTVEVRADSGYDDPLGSHSHAAATVVARVVAPGLFDVTTSAQLDRVTVSWGDAAAVAGAVDYRSDSAGPWTRVPAQTLEGPLYQATVGPLPQAWAEVEYRPVALLSDHTEEYGDITEVELVHPDAVAVIDDGGPGYAETGHWAASSLRGWDGGTTRYTTSSNSPLPTATWQLPGTSPAGAYLAEVYLPSGSNAPATTYELTDATGTRTLTVDQGAAAGRWSQLGRLAVEPPGPTAVTLVATGPGYIRADAVRFIHLSA